MNHIGYYWYDVYKNSSLKELYTALETALCKPRDLTNADDRMLIKVLEDLINKSKEKIC